MINNKGLKNDLDNMTDLFIRHEKDWNDYYVAREMSLKAVETCERFLHSAVFLPVGEFIGWQIDTRTFSSTAFSSMCKKVTMEDIAWIFNPVAVTSSLTSELMENLRTDDRKVYILSYAAGSARDVDVFEPRRSYVFDEDDHKRSMRNLICEMFEEMTKIGAVIQIIACGTMENTKGHGMILISIPDKMTLRMRSMLSIAFPHLVADEVDKLQKEAGEMKYLPDDCFMESMYGMLVALMNPKVDQKTVNEVEHASDDTMDLDGGIPDDTMGPDDGTPDDTIDPDGGTPEDVFENDKNGKETGGSVSIDDMELSIRSYNCLKRAGIKTVEDLQSLSNDELMNIRNLGRKSLEEVKQKLAEFQISIPLQETDYMARLDELVGLTDVKEQIKRIAAFAKMKKDMTKNGNPDISVSLNMGFIGNPGTAKTTVARIAAGIFHDIGLLPCSELVEVGRADLVAKYIGHTAIKVKEVFEKAKGKVLFIDEAYSLVDDRAGSFGDEAINTIIQEMENNRDKTIVIFAGYPDEMESLFARNPGLRSRVPLIINFNDYSAEEMVEIAELEAKNRGFTIGTEAYEKVVAICSDAVRRADTGNGRFCRNLIENAIFGYALRIYGNDDNDADADKNYILSARDFTSPTGMNDTKKIPIGFHA